MCSSWGGAWRIFSRFYKASRVFLLLSLLGFLDVEAQEPSFLRGADLSSLPRVEAGGGIFLDDGIEADALAILAGHGLNCVRLRLWHSPPDSSSSLEEVLAMSQRIKSEGLSWLLDFHFSDTWADPGQQTLPVAWQGLGFQDLRDSLRGYVQDVMTTLITQDLTPDYIQLGNEIGCGFLWPWGRLCGVDSLEVHWQRFTSLLEAAREGAVAAGAGELPIILHHQDGGDAFAARNFFTQVIEYGFEPDMLGLSYYPWWHGDLNGLATNLGNLAFLFERPVLLLETAYPWTLEWADQQNNLVGLPDQLLPDFPATPGGQMAFLDSVQQILQGVWGGYGRGYFLWEPAWVSAPQYSSPWENLTLFDFNGNSLPAISILEAYTSITTPTLPESMALSLYPNPSNGALNILTAVPVSQALDLELVDLRGRVRRVDRLDRGERSLHLEFEDQSGNPLPSGLFLLQTRDGQHLTRKGVTLIR